jgi:hypothetical protein
MEDMVREFGVGFFPNRGVMQNRSVIPIHKAKGELVAYAGRTIDGSEPRYRFPAGFHKSLELFNLHRVRGELSVILVEGFFDCMKVTQAGFPRVALMGSTMSKTQEDLLVENLAGPSLRRPLSLLDFDKHRTKSSMLQVECKDRSHLARLLLFDRLSVHRNRNGRN